MTPPTYAEVIAACDAATMAAEEAGAAADAVLAHSDRWLTFHPFQHARLRRDLIAARQRMLDARSRMMTLSRAYRSQRPA